MLLSIENKKLKVTPETTADITFLQKYPGFLKGEAPATPWVIKSLAERLVARKVKFRYTSEVKERLFAKVKKELPEEFYYFSTPLPFQDLALRQGAAMDNVGFLLDPGLGKSKLFLDWAFLKKAKKVVLVCPSPLVVNWFDEIAKHRPEFKPFHISSMLVNQELEKAGDANFLLCSYTIATQGAGFLAHWGADCLGLDEALIKNPDSQRTQALTHLSQCEGVKYRALLSGTLVNNHEGEVFAPVNFLEPALFGNSKYKFQQEYYNYSRGDIKFPIGVKPQMREELRSVLRSVSIVMRKEEYLSSLPEKEIHYLEVKLDSTQQGLVSQIIQEKRLAGMILTSPLVQLGKLIQVENYFYYEATNEDEDPSLEELFLQGPGEGNRKKRRVLETVTLGVPRQAPKSKRLGELAAELGQRRGIIWYNFSAEKAMITAALTDEYLLVDGNTKNPGEVVKEFNRNPNVRWLVAQSRVLNYGVTVLGRERDEDSSEFYFNPEVDLEIFMSLSFSYEIFVQQQDRIHRIGQKRKCDYYILLSDGPGEKRVRVSMERKMDVRAFMLENQQLT